MEVEGPRRSKNKEGERVRESERENTVYIGSSLWCSATHLWCSL